VPPRPILLLLADDCRPYHSLTTTAPSPFHCSAIPSLHSRDASARSSTVMPHAAHPADGASAAEGVLSRPRHSPAGVRAWPSRCGALACLLVPRGHRSTHPFQRVYDNGVRTKLLRCRLHANPVPLSTSLHACALTLSERSQALAATPSHPVSPGAHPYKKDHPFCAQCPPPPPVCAHR
jgi:hypothetical protein